jgi:hypothetical protein
MNGVRRIALVALSGLFAAGLMGAGAAGGAQTPALVKPGSQWTLFTGPLGYCGVLTFATQHMFSDNDAGSGRWRGTSTLVIHWTAGPWTGQRFTGTYSSSGHDYSGTLTFDGQSQHALMERGQVPCPV